MTQFDPLDRSDCYKFEILKILDGGLKMRNLGNGLTDRHEIWQSDAYGLPEHVRYLKFPLFENQRWRTAAS